MGRHFLVKYEINPGSVGVFTHTESVAGVYTPMFWKIPVRLAQGLFSVTPLQ